MKHVLSIVAAGALLAGCAQNQHAGSPTVVQAATPQQEAELLGRVKALEGKWEMQGPQGAERVEFHTSSGGSVVREVMFPGQQHEMTNVYHMDGPSIVMTHYCAMGNQPRMRATSAANNQIVFKFDTVTNMTSPNQPCMKEMTIVFKDNDHIIERWASYTGDKLEEMPGFEFTRVK